MERHAGIDYLSSRGVAYAIVQRGDTYRLKRSARFAPPAVPLPHDLEIVETTSGIPRIVSRFGSRTISSFEASLARYACRQSNAVGPVLVRVRGPAILVLEGVPPPFATEEELWRMWKGRLPLDTRTRSDRECPTQMVYRQVLRFTLVQSTSKTRTFRAERAHLRQAGKWVRLGSGSLGKLLSLVLPHPRAVQ